MTTTKIIAATAVLLGWVGIAHGMPVCSATVAGKVSGTSACGLGSTNNDSLAQVNADAMFGFSDWLFDAKDDDIDGVNEGANSLALSLVGGTLSGTWSIAASTFSDVMLVFKSGGGNAVPDHYVAYLVGATGGTYASPFANANNGNPKNLSHVSVYVRGSSTTIPEPAIPALLGISFVVLGLARRRIA